MSVFLYKIIAMTTMMIDHMGDSFFCNDMTMRCIGRFAFPCYAFLLAEGFRHIRSNDSRVSAHTRKLLLLALLSEFCYDLLECGFDVSRFMDSQNNIITLLLAMLGLIATEKWKDQPVYVAAAYGLTAFLNYACGSNYRFAGVLLVYAFYWYLNTVMQSGPKFDYFKRFLFLLGIMLVYIPIYHWARFHFVVGAEYVEQFVKYLPWYITHIGIAALLAFYNGQVGYKAKWFGHFYSWFYPAHLLLLGIIKILCFA